MPTIFNPPLDPSDVTPRHAPPWIPRIHTGYFYINDRQHYLYAKKKALTLRDATKYIFELGAVPEPGTTEVLVEGVPFSSFEVVGNELHLMATDQESFASFWNLLQYDETQFGFILHGFAFGPSNQVAVSYKTLLWEGSGASAEPTGNVYQSVAVNETFRIKEAARIDYQLTTPRHIIKPTGETLLSPIPVHSGFLPDPPKDGAPVVVSDDTYQYTDERGFQTEFAVDPVSAEIAFNTNRNFVQNPSFEVTATGEGFHNPNYPYPLEWWTTDDLTVLEGTGDAFHGTEYRCLEGTGQLIQIVDNFDSREPWTFSIYSKGDGTGHLLVSFLDEDGFYFNTAGQITSTGEPDLTIGAHDLVLSPTDNWTRSSITFGTTDPTQCEATGTFTAIPSSAAAVELKIKRTAGEICVDAVAAEKLYTPSDFEPLDPNITIEYEGSTKGHWLPEPSGEFPLEINVLDINPIRMAVPGGFLCVEEFSDIGDYGLGIGEIVEGSSAIRTGILQITGAVGVNVGRKHLPYAKTSGFYKFPQRNKFHINNPAITDDISDLTIEDGTPDPVPASLEWVPKDGLRTSTSNDEVQLVTIPDNRISHRIDAVILDDFSNPASSYRASVISASGIVDREDPITSHLGIIWFNYSPPSISTTGDVGQIDTITVKVEGVEEDLPVFGYTPADLDLDEFLN